MTRHSGLRDVEGLEWGVIGERELASDDARGTGIGLSAGNWDESMNCQRCLRAVKAVYRAYNDVIDLRVCAACASEAWWMGLRIEILDQRPTHHQRLVSLTNRYANAGRS
jgi:hypothetical protein